MVALVSPANDARFVPGANILFDWTEVSGAASYTIEIDDQDTFASPFILNQSVISSQVSTKHSADADDVVTRACARCKRKSGKLVFAPRLEVKNRSR